MHESQVVTQRHWIPTSVRNHSALFICCWLEYPVRNESGLTRVDAEMLSSRIHAKSDNRDFMVELEQFVREH